MAHLDQSFAKNRELPDKLIVCGLILVPIVPGIAVRHRGNADYCRFCWSTRPSTKRRGFEGIHTVGKHLGPPGEPYRLHESPRFSISKRRIVSEGESMFHKPSAQWILERSSP